MDLEQRVEVLEDIFARLQDYYTSAYSGEEIDARLASAGVPIGITKEYQSVQAMNQDFTGADVQRGQFVLILPDSTASADYGKVYLKGTANWVYAFTLNTLTSIKGPIGPPGRKGDKGNPGEAGSSFVILGYFGTLDALKAAVPNPKAGDVYGVGTAPPYNIYAWDAVHGKWVGNGNLQGPEGKQGIQGTEGPPGPRGYPANVNGVTPDESGAINLTVEDLGAAPAVHSHAISDVADLEQNLHGVNLLRNWYFVNPINQRGVASDAIWGSYQYGLDGWKCFNTPSVAWSSNGYVVMKSGQQNCLIDQFLEGTLLSGKVCTLSALTDRKLHTVTGTVPFNKSTGEFSNMSVTTGDGKTTVRLWKNATSTYPDEHVIAVKLELGSQQTLAHQDESGNWVLNEIPDYGEQLARCQRYVMDLSGPTAYGVLGTGVAGIEEGNALIFCPLPVSMRTTPVASFSGDVRLSSNGSAGTEHVATSISVDHINSNGVTLNVQAAGLTVGAFYQLWKNADASAHILLSAEL